MTAKDKLFAMAKGFRGRSKNCYRIAKQSVEKALQYAYRDRKQKKRDMRRLWIQRVNAGSKEHGVRSLLRLPLFCALSVLPPFFTRELHLSMSAGKRGEVSDARCSGCKTSPPAES